METQAKLGDSEVVPLKFQVERLSSEVDALSSHNTWLNGQLQSQTDLLAQTRKNHASEVAQLRSALAEATNGQEESAAQLASVQRQMTTLESQNERLAKELRDVQTNAAQSKAYAEEELQKTQTVVRMQKSQLDLLQQRHDSVVGQLEMLKNHAIDAEQESSRAVQLRAQELQRKSKEVIQDQAMAFQQQVADLEEELRQVNRRLKDAEDGLLLTNTPSRRGIGTPSRPLAIRDRAEASGMDDEPLNLTALYGRLAETEDALAAETLRRKKTQILLERIKADIEASAPNYIRQRREFEEALERQQEYKKRLNAALDEAKSAREETLDYQGELGRLQARNKELEEETIELAKQVQTLLVSRSNSGSFGLGGGSVAQSAPTEAVVQMQSTNQRLSSQVRKMTATIKDLEDKLQTDTLGKKVQAYEQDLTALREERRRQEVMVESIVQQRDLYRALLAKHDSQILGSTEDEVSALQLVKRQSARTKTLEEEKSNLENDLARARAELAVVDKDKESASQRLARYEALNEELTKAVDRLQTEVSQAKADVARGVAEVNFYREKTSRLEESLDRNRNESARISASKNDLQRINAELQEALSKANVETSRYESELQQAKMKLRLAETQTEQAKAAEQRITDESNQLRIEISRQGALIESIQRIEARLSAKGASEEESLKAQILSLTEKVAAAESKNILQCENLSSRVTDQEATIKDLEQQREQAAKDALDAKKETLQVTNELQAATKKITVLESQLRAAKKKLGDSDDGQDIEVELRTKITTMTEELEFARKEITALKERAAMYEKLAKENEAAVAEHTKASAVAKEFHLAEIASLQSQLEAATAESAKGKEVIAELTNDLAAQRGERAKELDEVNKKMKELEGQMEHYQKDAEFAQNRYSQLESEVVVLRTDVATAQTNYERELSLHAAARADLRAAKEDAEAESRLRHIAEAQAAAAKSEIEDQKASLEQEKATMHKSVQEYAKNLEETRSQNALLHNQLDKIGEQIEKMQGSQGGSFDTPNAEDGTEEVLSLQKTVSELREVVKFVRAEKEMVQAQLDATHRAAERERAAASVAKRSLEEARIELKVLQESVERSHTGIETEGMKEKLKAAEQQAKLLGESNSHLREEMKKLESSLSAVKIELETSKSASVPSEKRLNELETEKAGLIAEKSSLLREIEDWKGRVQSLVSKFNQVDPAEHASLVKKAESLEAQIKSLESQKQSAEDESKRIRGLASRVSKELTQNKTLVESHKKTIAALTSEKEAMEKAQKDVASQKDLSEAKDKLTKLETERANEKIQLTGAQEMNDKLRERLRQFQKMIMEMKKKEATLEKELKEAKVDIEKQKQSPEVSVAQDKTVTPHPNEGTIPPAKVAAKTTDKETTNIEKATPLASKEVPKEATQDSATTNKPEKPIMLAVPAGGFKFAPSPPDQPKSPVKTDAPVSKPLSTEDAKPIETTKPSDVSVRQSNKRPADATDDVSETKKAKAPEPEIHDNAADLSKSSSEHVGGEAPTGDGTVDIRRRGSGEKKELSMKEKLLEKKRKLILAMQKKKEQMEQESAGKDERVSKKSKSDEPTASDPILSKELEIPDTTLAASKDQDETEEGRVESAVERETVEEEVAVEATPPTPLNAAANTFSPQGTGFGSNKPTFGIASGGFGHTGFGTAFGQSSMSAPATTFGQASGFGAGSTDGSFFGAKAPVSGSSSTGFGGTSTGFGSGSSFLNIKPPGSSATPPTFTFGSSASIVLPTPTNPSPQANMFSAFSGPNQPSPFAAKPLFGVKKETETITEEIEEGEEGEMEEPGS